MLRDVACFPIVSREADPQRDRDRGTARTALTNLRSGIFFASFHSTDEDPILAVRRDLELIEWLDRLGFEEAWIGEHHSAG